jgi:FkbM family methyltransferase
MTSFYAGLVGNGDLCFDVGAHLGNRAGVLAALGCTVVAVEPHPYLANYLRKRFAGNERVIVEEAALGACTGRATLHYMPRNLTISSLNPDWHRSLTGRRARNTGFSAEVSVATVTLNGLIVKYGLPKYCKLDIEGSDVAVLETLAQPLEVLSFEHVPHLHAQTAEAVAILEKLAPYRFNYFPRETHRFRLRHDVSGTELLEALREPAALKWSADVFAFRQPRP